MGCSPSNDNDANTHHTIKGRDFTNKRFPVYRINTPNSWIRCDPLPKESLTDTTKPLCEFVIKDPHGAIRIAIHNFATDTIDQRISPIAQVERWKRQFTTISPTDISVTPQAFSGYEGLYFRGTGDLKGANTTVLAWSLCLAPEHYRMLSHAEEDMAALYREMRADVTIKAVGRADMMELHEEDIIDFARSFELIEEIPSRS